MGVERDGKLQLLWNKWGVGGVAHYSERYVTMVLLPCPWGLCLQDQVMGNRGSEC